MRKITTTVFVTKARAVHGDKYDYSCVAYANAQQHVIIGCPTHGSFEQRPSGHLHGHGCPLCNVEEQRSNTEEFIAGAQTLHCDTYDYSRVAYVRTHQKVTIICREHGPFDQKPNDHLSGCGCKHCGVTKKRQTAKEFSAKATERHGDKYDYSSVVYHNNKTKVTIVCRVHGPFEQQPNSHLNGQGCPVCGDKQRRSNTEEFITKAQKVHGTKYDYSHVVYTNVKQKVAIICPDHGLFEQLPTNHLAGNCCPDCSGRQPLTTNSFIVKARAAHGDKYDYSRVVYYRVDEPVTIQCPKHGLFEQTPTVHLRGSMCPQCAICPYSQKAIRWLGQISTEQNINIQHAENGGEFRIPGTRWKADGYCAETNTIYEFHGDAYHGNPLVYQTDDHCHPFNKNITAGELCQQTVSREDEIRSLGYNLVVLWESQFCSSHHT